MAGVSRRARGTGGINTVVIRRVNVYLRKSPMLPGTGATWGIAGVDWEVEAGGRRLASGRTPADGKVRVPIVAGTPSVLKLIHGGSTIATYTVRERRVPEAANTLRGRQRRLASMGYQLGSPAVDGTLGRKTDRATLDYQADKAVNMTGVINATVQGQITSDAGY